MFWKVSSKIVAIFELISAAFFGLNTYQWLVFTVQQPNGSLVISSAISFGLLMLNLVAGIALLRNSILGYRLSLVNIAAQVFSINSPWFAYGYVGLLKFYAGAFINSPPGTYFLVGMGFDLSPGQFWVSFQQIAQKPQIALDLISLSFFLFLYRALKVTKAKESI